MKKKIIIIIVLLLAFSTMLFNRVSKTDKSIEDRSPDQEITSVVKNAGNSGNIAPSDSIGGAQNQSTNSNDFFLQILSPSDKSTVASSTVAVKGRTSQNAEVFINDQELKADSSGNFSADISLDEGENVISVSANDSSGAYAEKEISVTLGSGQ